MSEEIFKRVNASRREALRTMLMATAFVAPVVASFSMGTTSAQAAGIVSNQPVSNQPVSNQPPAAVPTLQDAALAGLGVSLVGAGLLASLSKGNAKA